MYTDQKRTRGEDDKFKFHISDEVKSNLFLLEEAESIWRREIGQS